MMPYRVVLAVFMALLVAPSAGAAQSIDRLVDELESVRARERVPAYALALVNHSEVLHAGAYGIADLASGGAATADTRFRIGSITKTFTALALLIAAEQGALNLATPFTQIAGPNLIDNPWADDAPVRIVNLLEHTAGLADLSYSEMYHSDPTPLKLADAVRDFSANRRVLWRPNEHYSYSNAGAGLAAYALELRTGSTYERFVRQFVFKPLSMDRASVIFDCRTAEHLATGYDSDRTTPIPYWHMLFRPFGAINATAGDMANFLMMMLNRGARGDVSLLPPGAIARMEQSRTTLAGQQGLDFGYGLGLYSWYVDGHRFFGHGGDGDGYLAHFGYNRRADLAYFVVINAFTHDALREMRGLIEAFVVKDLPIAALPAPAPLPADSITMLGAYRRATRRFGKPEKSATVALTIDAHGSSLHTTKPGHAPRALLPVREGLFRRADEPGATIAIVRDRNGEWTYHGARESFVRMKAQPQPRPAAAR